jgi:hypothetical protein
MKSSGSLQDANDYYETHRRKESEKLKKAQQKEVLQTCQGLSKTVEKPENTCS